MRRDRHFINDNVLVGNALAELGIEDRLIQALQHASRGQGRPVRKASDTVTIQLGFSLSKILDLVSFHL